MSLLLDAFTRSVAEGAFVEGWADGELIVTPWTLSDGEPVVVYTREVASKVFYVSDRGQASDSLRVDGLDFSRHQVSRSWEAVRAAIEQEPMRVGELSKWELGTYAADERLGDAVNRVAEAALRADGLRALAKPVGPATRFGDWVVREAGAHGLTVEPLATLPSTGRLRRKVSAKITGSQVAYVNAIGPRAEPWGAFDHARSLFVDSGLAPSERVTVIADGSKLTRDQVTGIESHSRVIEQRAFPDFLDELAA